MYGRRHYACEGTSEGVIDGVMLGRVRTGRCRAQTRLSLGRWICPVRAVQRTCSAVDADFRERLSCRVRGDEAVLAATASPAKQL